MNYLTNLIVIVMVDRRDWTAMIPLITYRGVEFYFRDDEFRDGSKDRLRVVHIGISYRMQDRVGSDHLRPDGLSSIFRSHLIIALAFKQNVKFKRKILDDTSRNCKGMAKSIIQKCPGINELVKEEFAKHHIFCLPVEEKDERECIKKNAIALLSWNAKQKTDFPQAFWLGKSHFKPEINTSGLWNIHFVYGKYCPEFLNVMKFQAKCCKRATS